MARCDSPASDRGAAGVHGRTALPAGACRALDALPLPMLRELRSDHAGETGAVWIYRGILSLTRDAGVRTFARAHLAAELEHLAFFERALPAAWQSRLTPLWRLAGWLLGALPALFGPGAVFRTIEAVETFVDHHYAAQVDALAGEPGFRWLGDRLAAFRADEVAHRDDAGVRLGPPGPVARVWAWIIARGSAAGVVLARRL